MCDGYHRCPICGTTFDCTIEYGHTEEFKSINNCMDDLESYCTTCQVNRWDEMIADLEKDDRL
jgi:hypothetical protein